MKKILHIKSSPNALNSVTNKLGTAIIENIRHYYNEVQVEELDIVAVQFPHITHEIIEAFRMPDLMKSSEQKALTEMSGKAISQIDQSDVVVISVPMHNYSIPSALKAYLDHIIRPGLTFGLTTKGPVGRFTGKKAYIAFSSGWDFTTVALKDNDYCIPYLKSVLKLIGIIDITVYKIEGVAGHAKDLELHRVIAQIVL